MSPTLDGLLQQNLTMHLANCFPSRMASYGILYKIGVRPGQTAAWDGNAPEDWWLTLLTKLDNGVIEDGINKLLQACASEYPGHDLFKQYAAPQDRPEQRGNDRSRIELTLPDNLAPDVMFAIMDRIMRHVEHTGGSVKLDMVRRGSTRITYSVANLTPEQVADLNRQALSIIAEEGVEGSTAVTPNTFSEYYMDPLQVEGPDSRLFAIDQIPASTTVKDLARGIMQNYDDDVWPARQGRKSQAVIDKVSDDGSTSQRLDPRLSLHDAGVRPNDTLRVSPERTAGAISPQMRDEALARVRNEVLDYAAAHPGFEVEANSPVAPTEYVFKFSAPGFAPPAVHGGAPYRIDYHEALVELSPDFPIKAPEVWWQTEIFHPNVHPDHGWVCLGNLQEHYRPSMNFGELCQMLVDLVGYRNYTVVEFDGRNVKGAALDTDAAVWAMTEIGQTAILGIGGVSLVSRFVNDDMPSFSFIVTRVPT